MLYDLKLFKLVALVLLAVLTAAAQTGPVVLKSPNGALEISIVRGSRCKRQAANWRIG